MRNRTAIDAGARSEVIALYDRDFFAWTRHAAAGLRSGRLGREDAARVAAEIEDMGKRDLKELNSRTQVLIMHLLKWQLQPRRRSASWRATIVAQRLEIDGILRHSPSLRPRISEELAYNYAGAVKRAIAETALDRKRFPAQCPFTVAEILDDGFWPAKTSGRGA